MEMLHFVMTERPGHIVAVDDQGAAVDHRLDPDRPHLVAHLDVHPWRIAVDGDDMIEIIVLDENFQIAGQGRAHVPDMGDDVVVLHELDGGQGGGNR